MASRSTSVGRPTCTRRSKRPGRSRAGSRVSAKLVAAMTTTPAPVQAVHASEELGHGLRVLAVVARAAGDARLGQGVDLVEEEDAGRGRARVLEQAAHAH